MQEYLINKETFEAINIEDLVLEFYTNYKHPLVGAVFSYNFKAMMKIKLYQYFNFCQSIDIDRVCRLGFMGIKIHFHSYQKEDCILFDHARSFDDYLLREQEDMKILEQVKNKTFDLDQYIEQQECMNIRQQINEF